MAGPSSISPDGLQLRRVRVMGANRIELTGFTDAHARAAEGAYGLFPEIISWKLRMFVPDRRDRARRSSPR